MLRNLHGFSFSWELNPHRFGALGIRPQEVGAGPALVSRALTPGTPAVTGDAPEAISLTQLVQRVVGNWLNAAPEGGPYVLWAKVGQVEDKADIAVDYAEWPTLEQGVPVPPVVVVGTGRRLRQAVDGADLRVPASRRHEVVVPWARLGVTAAEVSGWGGFAVWLDGLLLRGVAHKTSGADPQQQLHTWINQGTHLRELVVRVLSAEVADAGLRIVLESGIEGGQADPADEAQRWSGWDGYVGVVHLKLVRGAEAPVSFGAKATAKRKAGKAVEALGGDVAGGATGLTGLRVGVVPYDGDKVDRFGGRLVRELGVRGALGVHTGTFSNVGALPFRHKASWELWGSALGVAEAGVAGEQVVTLKKGGVVA